MFYCFIHSWFSSQEPCPACNTFVTTTTTTTNMEDILKEDWESKFGKEEKTFVVPENTKITAVHINGKEISIGYLDEEGKVEGFGWENGKLVAYLHCGVYKDILNLSPRPEPPQDYEILQTEKSNEKVITKVRRVRDGEVFAVGDKLVDMDNDDIIDGFINKGGWLWVSTNIGKCYGCSLGIAKRKKKQPLFTTEDNKPIYEGDECSVVSLISWSLCQNVKAPKHPFYGSDGESFKYFSTEQAAKDYVLMNKPCLSAEDIKVWLEKYFDYPNGINVNDVKELVRQKPNQ